MRKRKACKECNGGDAVVERAEISLRYPDTAIEVVVDDVCVECLKKSLKKPIE